MELSKGDRVEITQLTEDQMPVPVGTQGTVGYVSSAQVFVDWDNGRTLGLALPEDADCFRKVQ